MTTVGLTEELSVSLLAMISMQESSYIDAGMVPARPSHDPDRRSRTIGERGTLRSDLRSTEGRAEDIWQLSLARMPQSSNEIFVTAKPTEPYIHVFVGEERREPALAMHSGCMEKLVWGGKVVGLRIALQTGACGGSQQSREKRLGIKGTPVITQSIQAMIITINVPLGPRCAFEPAALGS